MYRLKLIGICAVMLWLAAACAESTSPVTAERAASLPSAITRQPQYDPLEIMVTYRADPLPLSPGQAAAVSISGGGQAGAMSNLILRENREYELITDAIAIEYGLAIRRQVYIGSVNIASFGVSMGLDATEILSQMREDYQGQIAEAGMSVLHYAAYVPNDPDFTSGAEGQHWALWRIDCESAWDYTLGSEDVLIAVVDTGVYFEHEELYGQVINPQVVFPFQSLDIVNDDNFVEDDVGHGTAIASIIAATGDNERKMIGVAPGCKVLPVKISNDLTATTPDIIAGCMLALELGAKVINLSFGSTAIVAAEQQMVDEIWNSGALIICSAGNSDSNVHNYPGAFDNAVSVGGTTEADGRWEDSNWGNLINIAAPAERLRVATISTDHSYSSSASGTSFSTALASGAAGLLYSLSDELTNTEIRNAVESTGPVVPGFVSTIRRIDIGAAIWEVVRDGLPSVTGTPVMAGSLVGAVPEADMLDVSVSGAVNVARIEYILDLAPVGVVDAVDPVVQSATGPDYAAQLAIPADCANQQAWLTVRCYNSWGIAGDDFTVWLNVFNTPGDINLDGEIDLADAATLQPLFGLSAGDSGYLIFADGNLDGVINELDLAWIGYNWDG